MGRSIVCIVGLCVFIFIDVQAQPGEGKAPPGDAKNGKDSASLGSGKDSSSLREGKDSAKLLQQAVVTGEKTFMEQRNDRLIIYVDAAVTIVGATALEVLQKCPGVSIDKDGNISLKGKQGVLVMIDGKPTYLSGPDLANLLTTMNANQLDQVEIMTNPSAKYDAAGRFDSAHELTADADYIVYQASNHQLFSNTSTYPDGTVTGSNQLNGDLPSTIRIYSGKIDYSQSLSKGIKLESGWKSSLVQTENGSDYFDLAGGGWRPDYGKTNDFDYRENINAGYLNLNRESGKWSLQGAFYSKRGYPGRKSFFQLSVRQIGEGARGQASRGSG
jgi:hypothetical protein